MNDALEAVVSDMVKRAGEQAARQWLAALGMRQALDDMDRRDAVTLAVRLFDAGATRAEVFQRLTGRGLSKYTANRRIRAALVQRGRHIAPPAGHASGIATRPPAP